MHYYGTRLSENISRREPEGYLLCLNVPVARTGVQEYLPEELGLPGNGPPGMVEVYRPDSEVFSPETIASFEGICFNLTQPLRRMETEYSEMRIKIPYIAQFSEVRFLYPSTVRYMDGI